MAEYQLGKTGTQIDNILNNALLTSTANDLYLKKTDANTTYLSKADFNDVIYTSAYVNTGQGDKSYSSWIPFEGIEHNVGGGTWSNGHFIVPSAGYYLATFSCYTNQPGSGRASVARLDSNSNLLEKAIGYGNTTTSITDIFYCNAGDHLVAGAYTTGYPVYIYTSYGHNRFTIMKIR